jgi:hypothetical protein
MAKPVALRTSLIWHDEVMSDVVSERPQVITIGPHDGSTFITPDIGLPKRFAIVRPGSRGYMLALGEHMRGTVCIGGVEHDVAALVRASETPGFAASQIGGLDWGVIELDPSGAYKVFFQFVPLEEAVPVLPKPVLVAGATGYALSATVLSIMWGLNGFSIDEAIFRGAGLATLALGAAALVRWLLRQDGESRASLAFSLLLHAAILFATFRIYSNQDPFVYPGPRDLTGTYLVTRLEPSPQIVAVAAPKPAPKEPVARGIATPLPPAPVFHEPPPPRKKPAPAKAPRIDKAAGKADDKHDPTKEVIPGLDAALGGITKHGGTDGADRLSKAGGDDGDGDVGGDVVGPTTKSGGGDGKTAGHFKQGDPKGLEIGKLRKPSMCVGSNCGTAPAEITIIDNNRDREGTTLTAMDIDRVIRSAQGLLTKCYQVEVNRDPTLAGTVQVRFVISAEGRVESAKVTDDTIRNHEVGECVANRIHYLRFPAKGRAVVNYPFVFQVH